MRNAGLDEEQTGIKIANNLRYAERLARQANLTLMAESKEELKSLLRKLKEKSEKAGWKLNFRKLRSWHLVPSFHGK